MTPASVRGRQHGPDGPRVICLIGVDGVGKTTQANALARHLERRGRPAAVVWLRFSHRWSLPVLALARLVGASTMRRVGDHRIGSHDWRRAPWVGRLYTRTLAWDLRLASRRRLARLLSGGTTVVCDRFAHDSVVDLAVSFHDPAFIGSAAAQRLLRTPPLDRQVVLLDPGEPDHAVLRRPDLALDPKRAERIRAYRSLAMLVGLTTVDASGPAESVQRRLQELVA